MKVERVRVVGQVRGGVEDKMPWSGQKMWESDYHMGGDKGWYVDRT